MGGISALNQRQGEFGSFMRGGIDGEKSLPNKGRLKFEYATSRGRIVGGGNVFNQSGASDEHNGNAFRADLEQPLGFYEATLRANYSRADANYLNPFGATIAPGAERAAVSIDLKPRASRVLHLGLLDERNRTANVNNNRVTASLGWNETWRENFRTFFNYDYRKLNDTAGGKETTSNLITVGAEYKPTDKIELSVKREQNLGEADPTCPDQTTFSASYRVNQLTRIFLTERLASAPIVPIADVAATGFASTNSRRETAIGVETKIWQHTALNGRYQIENGINGADSFAVIGLQNSLPVSKALSLDLGYERGFHLAGAGQSYDKASVGFSWQPLANFRSSPRYELRNRNGFGQAVTIGATSNNDTSANIRIGAFTGTLIEQNIIGAKATTFGDPGAGVRSVGDGVRFVGTSGGTIRNNLIGFSQGKGIGIEASTTGVTISNNEIRGNGITNSNLDGVEIENSSSAITVSGNLIVDAAQNALLTYSIAYTNTGGTHSSNLVVADGIPANTDFKVGSATNAPETSGLTAVIAYSNDNGATWTYTPVSGGGGAVAGYDRSMTKVRWAFTGNLGQTAPNNTGSVGFTVRIR